VPVERIFQVIRRKLFEDGQQVRDRPLRFGGTDAESHGQTGKPRIEIYEQRPQAPIRESGGQMSGDERHARATARSIHGDHASSTGRPGTPIRRESGDRLGELAALLRPAEHATGTGIDRFPEDGDGHLLGDDQDVLGSASRGGMPHAGRQARADDRHVGSQVDKEPHEAVWIGRRAGHLNPRITFQEIQDLLMKGQVLDGDQDAGAS
jgi:hypothetical protein